MFRGGAGGAVFLESRSKKRYISGDRKPKKKKATKTKKTTKKKKKKNQPKKKNNRDRESGGERKSRDTEQRKERGVKLWGGVSAMGEATKGEGGG